MKEGNPKPPPAPSERIRIVGQLLFFGLSFHLVFFASKGGQSIATSVIDGRLAYDALGTLYIGFMLGAVLVTPRVVAKLGAKWALFLGSLAYVLFSAAFFLPARLTLLPAGAAVGVAAALMWGAKGAYLGALSARYAAASGRSPLAAAALLNGVFFATYQLAGVLGNASSSVCLFLQGHSALMADSGSVLTPGRFASGPDMFVYVVFAAASVLGSFGLLVLPSVKQPPPLLEAPSPTAAAEFEGKGPEEDGCGDADDFCPDSYADDASMATLNADGDTASIEEQQPGQLQGEAGPLLSELQQHHQQLSDSAAIRIPTWRTEGRRERLRNLTVYKRAAGMARLLRKPEMLLLVPFIVFTGMQQGFTLGDFTRSIVRATAGTEAVGFTMAAHALVAAVASWVLGKIAERLGPRPLFVLGFVAYGSFAAFWITFLRVEAISVWVLDNPLKVLLAWGGVLGLGDAAVANVFCNSVLLSFFTTADTVEAAFSNLKFWQSLGAAVALFVAPLLQLETKLGGLIAALVVGSCGVFFLDTCIRSFSSPHAASLQAEVDEINDGSLLYEDDEEEAAKQ